MRPIISHFEASMSKLASLSNRTLTMLLKLGTPFQNLRCLPCRNFYRFSKWCTTLSCMAPTKLGKLANLSLKTCFSVCPKIGRPIA